MKFSFYNITLLTSGSAIAGFAMSAALKMNMGGEALSVMWEAIHIHTGLTIGRASLGISLFMFLLLLFIDRRQLHIGTLVHSFIYSSCLDLFGLFHINVSGMALRIVVMVLAVLLFAIGLGVYSASGIGRGPYEGLCFALSSKLHIQVRYIRCLFDFLFVLTGWLLGGSFGLCTIFCIVFTGPVMQAAKNHFTGCRSLFRICPFS